MTSFPSPTLPPCLRAQLQVDFEPPSSPSFQPFAQPGPQATFKPPQPSVSRPGPGQFPPWHREECVRRLYLPVLLSSGWAGSPAVLSPGRGHISNMAPRPARGILSGQAERMREQTQRGPVKAGAQTHLEGQALCAGGQHPRGPEPGAPRGV